MSEPTRHFTYARLMSALALFLALTSGSIATADVPDDSVDSAKVIDERLKSHDLKDGAAVKSSDVVDQELASSDIRAGAVRSLKIATNAVASSEIATNAVGASELATDSISSSEIASSAVGGIELLDGSITGTDVGDGEIDADEIGADNIYRAEDGGVAFDDTDSARNGDFGVDADTAECGDGELIAGGAKWDANDESEDELFISEIKLNMDTDAVTVLGANDTGSTYTLRAEAICISY